MPARDEWYRSPEWTPEARDEFERRLMRAHGDNRQQYVRIKALALSEADEVDGAEELLHRTLDDPKIPRSWSQTAWVHWHLGGLYRGTGRIRAALEQYQAALEIQKQHGSFDPGLALDLAEVLVESSEHENLADVLEILSSDQLRDELVFHEHFYRYAVAAARLSALAGDVKAASEWGLRAIEVASDRAPRFPRHPEVGLVDTNDPALAEMWELARRR